MTHLCLGGGSIRGFCFLGALHYLVSSGKLKKVEKFHGCSIGSIIGILLIANKTPLEIFQDLLEINLAEYWNPDIKRLIKNYSLVGSEVFDFWKEYLARYMKDNITIKEFNKEYSTDINIISVCLDTKKTVIFNETDFPDLPVITAIIASASIPFLFPPCKINDCYYIDGSAKCLSGCLDETITPETLVIKMGSSEEKLKINDLKDYALAIMRTLTTPYEGKTNDYTLSIKVTGDMANKYNFNDLTVSDKTNMFLTGLKQSENYFKDITLPTDEKENSIPEQ